MIGIVPITSYRKVVALSFVDFEDYADVKRHRWNLTPGGYAVTASIAVVGYSGEKRPLHRLICGLKAGDGRVVHHRNEIKADNRRQNLKVCADSSEANTQPHPKAWRRVRLLAEEYQAARWREQNLQAEGI